MRWLLAPLVVLGLAGCPPALTEGRYSCVDDVCPPGWHCHSDDVCRSAPEGDAGGPPGADAARPARSALSACTSDADCDSGECYRGGPRVWRVGYCSLACASDGACEPLGPGAHCDDIFESRCNVRCTESDTDCPGGFQCVAIFRAGDTLALGECFPLGAPIRPSGDACTDDTDCADADFNCISNRCHRPCTTGRDLACAPGERCVPTASDGEICTPDA